MKLIEPSSCDGCEISSFRPILGCTLGRWKGKQDAEPTTRAPTRWPALSCDTQAYSRRAPYRPAAPRTTHTRWPELDHAPTFAPAVQIDVIIDIEFRLSILYNAMLSHNEYVGARTAMPLHSCRMPEKLRDPVSSGTLSSSSPSATGSHACPESLCMLRSLPWFRNMPSVLQPSVPEAMRVAPQISERARGMQHAHHNAPCVRMLRVTYVCAVEPCARAQFVSVKCGQRLMSYNLYH